MLLARRNEGLEAVLREHLDDLNAEAAAATISASRKGKRKA